MRLRRLTRGTQAPYQKQTTTYANGKRATTKNFWSTELASFRDLVGFATFIQFDQCLHIATI